MTFKIKEKNGDEFYYAYPEEGVALIKTFDDKYEFVPLESVSFDEEETIDLNPLQQKMLYKIFHTPENKNRVLFYIFVQDLEGMMDYLGLIYKTTKETKFTKQILENWCSPLIYPIKTVMIGSDFKMPDDI